MHAGDRPTRPAPGAQVGPWFLVGLALLLATLLALLYGLALDAPMVFDDVPQLVESSELAHPWPGWHALLTRQRTITTLTFAWNRAAGGLDPWGYRLVNVVIHGLASLVLFGLVRRTLARLGRPEAAWIAGAAALLWVVHPLQTQSVTYLVQRAESLMGLFALLAFHALVRAADETRGGPRGPWSVLCVLACVLGMGSKPVMVVVPVLLLAFDRLVLATSWHEIVRERRVLHVGALASWAVLAATGLPALLVAPETTPTVGFGMEDVTSLRYLATQPGVLLHYLRLAVWPDPLVLDPGWPLVESLSQALVPGLVVVALLSVTAVLAWRGRPIAFLGLWFFGILAPTSSLVPVRDAAFEHRMYLPLAALTLGAALAAARLPLRVATGLVGLAVVLLGVRTHGRNEDYRDEVRLWSATVRDAPDHGRPYVLLAEALLARGRLDGAQATAERCLERLDARPPRIDDDMVRAAAHAAAAVAACRGGDLERAEDHHHAALALYPASGKFHGDHASTLAALGRWSEARAEHEEALRLEPDDPALLNNAAWFLATAPVDELRDGARAVALVERALTRLPAPGPDTLDTLAAAKAETGLLDEAVRIQERVLAELGAGAPAAFRERLERYRAGRPWRQ